MIKAYYRLTKPGIIRGNLVTAFAGFMLASQGSVDAWLLLAMLAGLSLVVAAACVFNNYLDQDIDKVMDRTKDRALITGQISGSSAVIFASVLLVLGAVILAFYTNYLALVVALAGFFIYVVVYGFWKRRSPLGTVVGSISGAVPPVVGYVAVSNQLDTGAQLLFLMLALWQMPHFYAIAMYRLGDYTRASIPVLPAVAGTWNTKLQIVLYIIAFIVIASLLTVLGYTGITYLLVLALLGVVWLNLAIKGFSATNDSVWARSMFHTSLAVITLLCLTISVDAFLLI